jgi:hypothetical protein
MTACVCVVGFAINGARCEKESQLKNRLPPFDRIYDLVSTSHKVDARNETGSKPHILMFAAASTFTLAQEWEWLRPQGVRLFQGKSTPWTRCQYCAIHTIACAVQFTFHPWWAMLWGTFGSRDAWGIWFLPMVLVIAEGNSVLPKSVLFSLFLGTEWNAFVARYAGNLVWEVWLCRMGFTTCSTILWIALFTLGGPARYSFHDDSPEIHRVLHASVIQNKTLTLPSGMTACVCGGFCNLWRVTETKK